MEGWEPRVRSGSEGTGAIVSQWGTGQSSLSLLFGTLGWNRHLFTAL